MSDSNPKDPKPSKPTDTKPELSDQAGSPPPKPTPDQTTPTGSSIDGGQPTPPPRPTMGDISEDKPEEKSEDKKDDSTPSLKVPPPPPPHSSLHPNQASKPNNPTPENTASPKTGGPVPHGPGVDHPMPSGLKAAVNPPSHKAGTKQAAGPGQANVTSKSPLFQKQKQGFNKKIIAAGLGATLIFVGLFTAILLTRRSQEIRQQAWHVDFSSSAECQQDGKASIQVSFTNTESGGSENAMDVVATDLQTGNFVDLGTVQPGDTKTGRIDTGLDALGNGQVEFALTWTNGRSGVDKRTSSYSGEECVPEITPPPKVCPLQPGSDQDILITFSEGIKSNGSENDAMTTIDQIVPAGTYKVTLSEFDDHTSKTSQTQPNERYFLKFQDSSGSTFAQSGSTTDLPEDEDFRTETVNDALSLTQEASKITAYHSAYPDTSSPNSIEPVCALLSPIPDESPTPTPTPTVTPTPTPSPTPTPPPACNSDCTTNAQCEAYDSNWVCHVGKCRHTLSRDDETCAVPANYSCNSDCSNDTQCQQANSAYECIQGNCRLPENPTSDSCTPVGTTPTPDTIAQVDLPEAGTTAPTTALMIAGGIILLLGAVTGLLIP